MSTRKKTPTEKKPLEEFVPHIRLSFANHTDETPVDRLSRLGFAQAIYKIVKGVKDNAGAVIGVEGPWGSGKTFLLHQVRRINNEDSDKTIKWMVFSPWNFEDKQHLISNFLNELAGFIDKLQPKPWWIRWLDIINDNLVKVEYILRLLAKSRLILAVLLVLIFSAAAYYFDIAVLLGALGSMGAYKLTRDTFKEMPKYIESLADEIRCYAILANSVEITDVDNLNTLKKRIHDKLNATSSFKKIVVCIEDIDRLTAQEVMLVMQLVRGVADFPRIIYLLGYDRKHVVKSLDEISSGVAGYGEGYLQKIVDAAFQLPSPRQEALFHLGLDSWHQNAKQVYGEDYRDKPYWQANIPKLLNLLDKNIRDFERVSNRALIMLVLMGNKSNPLDVLFCAYLQEFEPPAWEWLKVNGPSSLNHGLDWYNGKDKTHLSFESPRGGVLVEQIPSSARRPEILQLIESVIPAYREFDQAFTSQDREIYRFGDPDIMYAYLTYEIGDIPEVQQLLSDILLGPNVKREAAIKRIIKRDEAHVTVLLKSLKELHIEKKIADDVLVDILISLGKALDSYEGYFGREFVHEVYWMTVIWLNQAPLEKAKAMFIRVVTNWLHHGAMYLPLEMIHKIALEQEWINNSSQKKSKRPFEFALSEEQKKSVLSALDRAIAQWNSDKPKWLEHPRCAEMLLAWLDLNQADAHKTISDWINDGYKFMKLLKSFVRENHKGDKYIQVEGLTYITGLKRENIIKYTQEVSSKPYIANQFQEIIQMVEDLPDPFPESAKIPWRK
jgi:hypothetical protein